MNLKEKHSFMAQEILNDISLLKYGHIYEIERVRCSPSYRVLGERLEKNLKELFGDIGLISKGSDEDMDERV